MDTGALRRNAPFIAVVLAILLMAFALVAATAGVLMRAR